MGALLGRHADNRDVRDIYDSSTLLPLMGADQRERVIQYARLRRSDQRNALRGAEGQVLLVIDGAINIFQNDQKLHTIYAIRNAVSAPENSLQTAARRARYDATGVDSQIEETTGAIRTNEILVYWRTAQDVVCRYSCQTEGEEVILKSLMGSRVELFGRVRYLSVSLRSLQKSSSQSLNVLTNADLVQLVADIPFFANIPQDQLVVLTELSTIRVYPAKSVVFREDEGVSTQMFVTLAGTLEVSSSRATAPLAKLEAGSFFGEMSLLINIPRAATVTTVESCLLMSIEKEAFHTFLDRLPNVKSNVYGLLKERLFAKAMMSGVLPYFKAVPPARLMQFSHGLTIEDHVHKGDCILDQEAKEKHRFGVVVYGVIEIVAGEGRPRSAKRDQSVFLTPGCYFGPFTFERLGYQRGKIFARSAAVLLTCPFSELLELFQEFPEVAAEAHIAWFGERCDLAAILRHAALTQRFQTFLEAEHSDENFTFCLDVQTFRSAARGERFELATYIMQRYIVPGSPKEVNLPATIRDSLILSLKTFIPTDEVPTTFYDSANDEIMRLMTKDSFPRFKKSPLFQGVLDALDPHLNRKGSKLLEVCHAFRESISIAKHGKVEGVAAVKMQRMLSTIRKSHERQGNLGAGKSFGGPGRQSGSAPNMGRFRAEAKPT
ncbi:hypothetical protein P43SY_002321 [Pythium insidiosum]|uniref:Cyclic nucleotide-binding domain-containing protein n=1 Tax=Pythium insidiosum TaxID=114742 RepID=A0AAD5QF59_PYTIN|nr:hypothetical protein P43SY_002321 [Pythium insidiosum]